MILNLIQSGHVKTSPDRSGTRCQSADHGRPSCRREGTACCPGHPPARLGPYHLGPNGRAARRGPRQRFAAPATLPRRAPTCSFFPKVGWPEAGHHDARSGGGIPRALGRTSSQRGRIGGVAAAGCSGRKTGAEEGRRLGGVPSVGPAWMAQGGSGHPPSQERSRRPGGLEKNSRRRWLPC
jgi:hypothetical protein